MNLFILLQAAAQSGKGGMTMNILMIVLLFVIFYFFMIRPQSKKQKELRKFQDSLCKGKKVVTQGGVYGTIQEVSESYVILEVAPSVRVRVNKGMVFEVPEQADAKKDEPKKEVKDEKKADKLTIVKDEKKPVEKGETK